MKANSPFRYTAIASPVKQLLALSDGRRLTGLLFANHRHSTAKKEGGVRDASLSLFKTLQEQLDAYFSGVLREFDLPLAAEGTPFQQSVWNALKKIPYGSTVSYAQLAKRIKRPTAVRAVAAAVGRNPLPIVIPCHRVIGSDDSLTGFGGGLERKRFLLEHEGRVVGRARL